MNPYDCRLLSEEEKTTIRKLHTHARAFALNAVVFVWQTRACVSKIHRRNYTVHFTQNEMKKKKSRIEKWFQVSWVGHLYIVHCVCLHWNYVMFVRNYKTSSSSVYLARYLHYDRMRSFPSFVAFTSFYRSAKASQQLPSIQCCSPTMCMWPTNERSKKKIVQNDYFCKCRCAALPWIVLRSACSLHALCPMHVVWIL